MCKKHLQAIDRRQYNYESRQFNLLMLKTKTNENVTKTRQKQKNCERDIKSIKADNC